MEQIAAALGDGARWRIVELLAERPRSVGELAELTGLRQPQTTKHLQTLARAGLVTVFPLGQRRVYAVEAAPLKQLVDKGFTAGDTATASARKKTVVWVAKGEKAAGQAVADELGGNPTVQEDKSVEAGRVMVFLGSDFKAPSGAEGSGSSQNAAGSSAAAPPPEQSDEKPITAEGVPCVN